MGFIKQQHERTLWVHTCELTTQQPTPDRMKGIGHRMCVMGGIAQPHMHPSILTRSHHFQLTHALHA